MKMSSHGPTIILVIITFVSKTGHSSKMMDMISAMMGGGGDSSSSGGGNIMVMGADGTMYVSIFTQKFFIISQLIN